jgi:hypothetical protein
LKDGLAEALLARVMGWDQQKVALERAVLQHMARYKYDEYQQFAPGQRFIESLALWLRQFPAGEARADAYEFVRRRLISISAAEMDQLVGLSFPTLIRPWLMGMVATAKGVPNHRVKAIEASEAYKLLLRQTLFLGLSDGANTGRFRRANPFLSNEQVWHAYEISDDKAADFKNKLKKDLQKRLEREPTDAECRYRAVVLLDDFTASGLSYLRNEGEGGPTGKIQKIWKKLKDLDSEFSEFVDQDNVSLRIVFYVAAAQGIERLRDDLPNILGLPAETLKVVHALPSSVPVVGGADDAFLKLSAQDRFFDPEADDEHGEVGGASKRYGFADGRLPVVLFHNTPNNSLFLLWAEAEHSVRGLFPRVSRHRRFG